jgi:hypothetical protein
MRGSLESGDELGHPYSGVANHILAALHNQ